MPWCLKRFYEVFEGLHKCEKKNLSYFFSLRPGSGQKELRFIYSMLTKFCEKKNMQKKALSSKNRANSHQPKNLTKITRTKNHKFEWFSYERGNGWLKNIFLTDFS